MALRVLTLNGHRLFDLLCDTGACAAGDYEVQATRAEFDQQVAALARGIASQDADIVLLQEIEKQWCLDQLNGALDGGYASAVLGETGANASVDVAVMARGTVLETRRHRATPIPMPDGGTTTFARELWEVHLDMQGRRVVAIAAHFRSQRDDDPERRHAEAMAARSIALATAAEFPNALVVLGGDLNDNPGSPPLMSLEAGGDLFRVTSELGPDEDDTYYYFSRGDALDHLFIPQAVRSYYVPGSVSVERDVPGSMGGLGGSDHAGVRADFRIP